MKFLGLVPLAVSLKLSEGCWFRDSQIVRDPVSRTLEWEASAASTHERRLLGKRALMEACSDNIHFADCSMNQGSAIDLEKCLYERSLTLTTECAEGVKAWKDLLVETSTFTRGKKTRRQGLRGANKHERAKERERFGARGSTGPLVHRVTDPAGHGHGDGHHHGGGEEAGRGHRADSIADAWLWREHAGPPLRGGSTDLDFLAADGAEAGRPPHPPHHPHHEGGGGGGRSPDHGHHHHGEGPHHHHHHHGEGPDHHRHHRHRHHHEKPPPDHHPDHHHHHHHPGAPAGLLEFGREQQHQHQDKDKETPTMFSVLADWIFGGDSSSSDSRDDSSSSDSSSVAVPPDSDPFPYDNRRDGGYDVRTADPFPSSRDGGDDNRRDGGFDVRTAVVRDDDDSGFVLPGEPGFTRVDLKPLRTERSGRPLAPLKGRDHSGGSSSADRTDWTSSYVRESTPEDMALAGYETTTSIAAIEELTVQYYGDPPGPLTASSLPNVESGHEDEVFWPETKSAHPTNDISPTRLRDSGVKVMVSKEVLDLMKSAPAGESASHHGHGHGQHRPPPGGDHIRFRNRLPDSFENQRGWFADSFDADGDGVDLRLIPVFWLFSTAFALLLFLVGRAIKRLSRGGSNGGGDDADVPEGYCALPEDATTAAVTAEAGAVASAAAGGGGDDDDDSIVVTGTPVNPPPSVNV